MAEARKPTNLHDAARSGNVEALMEALAEVDNVELKDKHQRTPLHLAAWANQTAIMDVLFSLDADVNATAMDKMTPLHFASQRGSVEAVKL